MESREHRRKSRRYHIQWKAAVVFDRTTGRPTLHTQTDDLSAGGASIHSPYSDLTGQTVTLLIAQPQQEGAPPPPLMRVRAQVVSSIHKPGKSTYRHGLSFVRAPGDGLDTLEEMLKAVVPAAAESAQVPAAAAPAAAPAAGLSRLEMLKQMAQAKAAGAVAEDPSKDYERQIAEGLTRAHAYLDELNNQLNVVNPPFAGRGYQLAGVPEFAGLTWKYGSINVRNKTNVVMEQVGLYFTYSGNRQIKLQRDYPASERLRQQLQEARIEFQYNDKHTEKGSLVHTIFGFPCEVKAQVVFQAKFDTGKLLLKMRNVERFGDVEYLVSPAAVTQEALEELTGFLLGELTQLTLLRRNA